MSTSILLPGTMLSIFVIADGITIPRLFFAALYTLAFAFILSPLLMKYKSGTYI